MTLQFRMSKHNAIMCMFNYAALIEPEKLHWMPKHVEKNIPNLLHIGVQKLLSIGLCVCLCLYVRK